MSRNRFRFNTSALYAVLAMALVYLAWQYYFPEITTGSDDVDGSLGIVVGSFVCSKPARNGIDVLYFERGALRRALEGGSALAWLGLNGLVMLAGWLTIAVGALRLLGRVA